MIDNFKLTEDNISKLLLAREKANYYLPLITEFSQKNKYREDFNFELAKLDILKSRQFWKFNTMLNVLEYDRCFRIRPKRDPETSIAIPEDFCFLGDGCTKRNIPSCIFVEEALKCFANEWLIKVNFTYEESLIAIEYEEQAKNIGLDTTYLLKPHPLLNIGCHILSPEYDTVPDCLGRMIKIKEPRFDVYWGMEKFQEWAQFHHAVREGLM